MDYKEKLKAIINSNKTPFADIDTFLKYFPELKESEDEKIRKALIEVVHNTTGDSLWIDYDVHKEDAIAWLEKQDETNKKPKFKVGDWVMLDRPVLITKVEDMPYNTYQYWTSDGTWFGDATNAKLWNISDAKDGDVLYLQKDRKKHIIIYKGIINEGFGIFVSAYCAYNGIIDDFCFGDVGRYVDIAYKGIKPATKEQRDFLFQKMKEAGYEWDTNIKQLKKIE